MGLVSGFANCLCLCGSLLKAYSDGQLGTDFRVRILFVRPCPLWRLVHGLAKGLSPLLVRSQFCHAFDLVFSHPSSARKRWRLACGIANSLLVSFAGNLQAL